jgi:hypothetical protein
VRQWDFPVAAPIVSKQPVVVAGPVAVTGGVTAVSQMWQLLMRSFPSTRRQEAQGGLGSGLAQVQ